MKTEMQGGASADEADGKLEERLSGRFAVELGRAERDYPALREKVLGSAPAARGRGDGRRPWPKLALPVWAAACLAVAVLVISGLLSGTATGPTVAPGPSGPGSSGVALASDGIPDQIDGQHVYRLAAQADWQDLSGSFLLGAYAVDRPIPCAPPMPMSSASAQPQSSLENALVPQCGTVELVARAQDNNEFFWNLAPRGLDLLTGWLDGPAIVMRVHTHDTDASGCSADQKTMCEAAVVVEAVVWSGSSPASPTPTGAALAADGIPAQIGGEHVYRLSEALPNGTASFLLGGYPVNYPVSCPASSPQPTAEADLVGQCGWIHLASSAGQSPGSGLFTVAPRGSDLLTPWLGGPAVVVRVHTHDPAAASCSADAKAACEGAVVVESVVWPVVPTQLAGERVYRAADQASFPTSGSFLLGGPFTKPAFMPPCPMPMDKNAAEQQLLPYCYLPTLDGIEIAPKSSIDEPNGEIVVARVHINDSQAAECPASDRAQCQASVVVEGVVWPTAGPSEAAVPTPNATTPNAASSEGTGPATSVGDGAPTTLNGETVYRASNLPAAQTFLLGGDLTRDPACYAPSQTAPPAKLPPCSFWVLDGIKVRSMVNLPETLLGQAIVAQLERGRSMAVCPGGSCTANDLVIEAIVWPASDVVPPPPAPSPTPMAS
jgi:hypothetical protein